MVHYRGSVPITRPLWSLPVALLCAQSYPESAGANLLKHSTLIRQSPPQSSDR